jgi:phosphoribosylamine--glycine ligase
MTATAETVLVVGGGGREHAIAQALANPIRDRADGTSPDPVSLYACAGNWNPGIDRLADGFKRLDTTDPGAVAGHAIDVGATMAVIGPEAPLQAAVADALAEAGVFAFGPSAANARIETDKTFQRRFMREHGIAGCPDFETFDDIEAACEAIDAASDDLVVKPAGLTGGKGVKVIGDQVTPAEAKAYLRASDYDRVVLEERLVGEEFTVQAFVANGDVRVTPSVQDHKRAYEDDEGPNTGGMGSYSDSTANLPFLDEVDYEAAVDILEATVDALDDYTGVLYGQFMLTADGVSVVEFNARFGDPEAMNTLPGMKTPLLEVLVAARDGESLPQVSFAEQATVCKYAVPAGYPIDPEPGTRIEIDDRASDDALLFYASVESRDDRLYTTTSRAFAVVGIGDTIAGAAASAEDTLAAIDTTGLRVRHDIGTRAQIESRVDHMNELRGSP